MTTQPPTTKEALEPCPKCNDCWALQVQEQQPPCLPKYVRCGRCNFNAPYDTWQARTPAPIVAPDPRGNYTDGFKDGWKAHFDAVTAPASTVAPQQSVADYLNEDRCMFCGGKTEHKPDCDHGVTAPASPAALRDEATCLWALDPETDYWQSACGTTYFNEDDPTTIHAGVIFCHRCGKRIEKA